MLIPVKGSFALPPALLLAGMVLLAGCKFDPNKRTGTDGTRPDAEPMKLAEPVADSISYEDRDRVDWKYVDHKGGDMTLNLRWDFRRCACEMRIYGELGGRVAKMPNKGKKYGEELILRDLEPGKYFFQFMAKGKDDYSDYFFTVLEGEPPDEFALDSGTDGEGTSLIEKSAPPPTKGGPKAKDPDAPPPEAARPKVEGVKPSSPPPTD